MSQATTTNRDNYPRTKATGETKKTEINKRRKKKKEKGTKPRKVCS